MDYERIQPFPVPQAFEFPELRALATVWQEKRAALEGDGAYKEFITRLQREWAIETGIIERLYTWDRGVTEILIEQGIEASLIAHQGGVSERKAEQIHLLIQDHLGIVEGLFSYIKGKEPLTEHFIRGLQAEFTKHQDSTEALTPDGDLVRVPLLKGEYKKSPNNPRRSDGAMHAYCPPELTKEEMENLVRMHRGADATTTPELKSAWLHHRFTQIHPFQDGNGRVARALASLVFLRAGLFPLVIRESDRQEYIGALESADAGNLAPLVTIFARRQREAILKALGIEQQAQQHKHADQIITAALAVLKTRFSKKKQEVGAVYEYADKLFALTESTLKTRVKTLDGQLSELTPPGAEGSYQARENSAGNRSLNRHYFYKEIVDVANRFGYFASLEPHRSWVRMTLKTNEEFDFVVSFHGYGSGETGILAASAFSYVKAAREGGGTEPVDLRSAATDLFQFNYIEKFESIEKRFTDWLESSMAIALAEWKRSLQA